MLRVLGERTTLALVGPEREVRKEYLSGALYRTFSV